MQQQLGLFEGLEEKIATLKLSGTATGERIGKFAFGEEVFIMVKAVVTKVTHGPVSELFARQQEAKTTEIVIIDPTDGQRMLDEAKILSDERFGITQMFGDIGAHLSRADAERGDDDEDDEGGADPEDPRSYEG